MWMRRYVTDPSREAKDGARADFHCSPFLVTHVQSSTSDTRLSREGGMELQNFCGVNLVMNARMLHG